MQTFQHFLLQFENSGKNASMPVQVNSHVLVRALVFENLYKTVFSVGTEFFFLCGHIWQRWGEGHAVSL